MSGYNIITPVIIRHGNIVFVYTAQYYFSVLELEHIIIRVAWITLLLLVRVGGLVMLYACVLRKINDVLCCLNQSLKPVELLHAASKF